MPTNPNNPTYAIAEALLMDRALQERRVRAQLQGYAGTVRARPVFVRNFGGDTNWINIDEDTSLPVDIGAINTSTSYTQSEDEDDMTAETKSKAKEPDQFSFVIKISEADNTVQIIPPPAGSTGFAVELYECNKHQLDYAYTRAFQFCDISKNKYGVPFNVWPRRNSKAYRELVAITERPGPNPSTIKDMSALRETTKVAIANIKEESTSECLDQIVRYLAWKLKGRQWNNSTNIFNCRSRVISLIHRRTGVMLTRCVASDSLIHPDSAVVVVVGWDGEREDTAIYSRKLFHEYGGECHQCKRNYESRMLHVVNGPVETVALFPHCERCLEEMSYFRCQNCVGRPYHSREEGCPRMVKKPFDYIHGYSVDVTRVIPHYFTTKKGGEATTALRYGLELEVLRKSNMAKGDAAYACGKAMNGHALLKSDSSIGPDGFEIVTAPATLDYHRNVMWKKFFTELVHNNTTAAKHVKSWDTGVCGLHIHITRAALTKMQLAKLLVFYHESVNAAFLSKIAGRMVGPNANYCKTARKKLRMNTHRDCSDHHEAICISDRNNGKTAEVRIFRGNATRHGIMRCLEFVDATVKWCGVAGAAELRYNNFLAWFNSPSVRATYPDLWKHLIQLGYLKTEHKSLNKKTLDLIPDAERIA